MLSDVRVEHVLGMGNAMTDDYNCWGATMYVLGAKDHLTWVDNREMTEWLMTRGEPIDPKLKPEIGDVLGLFEVNPFDTSMKMLIHTAVYVGNGKYLHKKGRNVAQIESLRAILKVYHEADAKVMVRLKDRVKERQ